MDALKGLTILVLIIGGVAGCWISIVYWRLRQVKIENKLLLKENTELRRAAEHTLAVEEAKRASDEELLDSVSDVLLPRG